MMIRILPLLLVWLVGCQTPESGPSPSRIVTIDSVWAESLNTYKTLRVYLPKGYDSGSDRYPVLYLHDGQNLFYDSTSFVGEWGIDESLDSLNASMGLSVIAVGINHGNEQRISEYSMHDSKYGTASGQQYLDFLVNQLKPWVDSTYRTQPEASETLILGSSLGGLISHYAFFQYPNTFGNVGIFSPAYWFDTLSFNLIQNKIPPQNKIYLYGGDQEGSRMVELIHEMEARLKSQDFPAERLTVSINPKGEHNEHFWKSEFPKAIVWFFKKD